MTRTCLIVLALLLAACGAPSDETATIPAIIFATATPSPMAEPPTRTPEPGFTLIPGTPIVPTETPVPCDNGAVFVSDITVPDNTVVLPGAPIDKRWAVQNTGSCNWTSDYRVAFFEGNQMGAASEHALFPARAGTRATVQVNMIAPDVPGDYTGRWQLRGPDGTPFGQVLFIKIVVVPFPTPTAAP